MKIPLECRGAEPRGPLPRDAGAGGCKRTPARAPAPQASTPARRGADSFTLLEVIIACALFFMVAFSVLELVTRGLVSARVLQQREADAGMVASVYAQTNSLEEETVSGSFDELYPDMYPGYSWVRTTTEIYSNGLFEVKFGVVGTHKRRGVSETEMTILLYRPMSPPGSASQGGDGLGPGGFGPR
ncbi:MAG: hypothetical protein JXQ71_14395 [Verrucomicrobia bacterium]|nr:hypothetical protein [Verrucomicrobiota bacterium]